PTSAGPTTYSHGRMRGHAGSHSSFSSAPAGTEAAKRTPINANATGGDRTTVVPEFRARAPVTARPPAPNPDQEPRPSPGSDRMHRPGACRTAAVRPGPPRGLHLAGLLELPAGRSRRLGHRRRPDAFGAHRAAVVPRRLLGRPRLEGSVLVGGVDGAPAGVCARARRRHLHARGGARRRRADGGVGPRAHRRNRPRPPP